MRKILPTYLDLILVGFYTGVFAALSLSGELNTFRGVGIFFSVPLIFFIPGYILLIVLSQNIEFSGEETSGLSIILSLCIIVLDTLIATWVGIPLNPKSFLIIQITTISLLLLIGIFFRFRNQRSNAIQIPTIYKVITLVVLGFLTLSIMYVSLSNPAQEAVTEFSLSSIKGDTNLPFLVNAQNDDFGFIVSVANHEGTNNNYVLKVEYDGYSEMINLPPLENGETWAQVYDLKLDNAFSYLKVNLILYKLGNDKPYRTLHFWINNSQ